MRKRRLGPSRVEAEPPLAPDAVPVTRYAGALKRHKVTLAAALLLGFVGGAGVAVSRPPGYISTTSVLAPPVTLHPGLTIGSAFDDNSRPPRDTTMDTEAQLAWSDDVLRRLATFPGFAGRSRADLKSRIGLTVPEGTHVLTISVRGATPTAAQRGAETVADAYLTLRQQILGGVQQRNREALEQYVTLLTKQLKALPGDENEPTRLTARTRRQEISKQIGTVEKQLSQLDSKVVQPGEVLRSANRPAARDGSDRDVTIANGVGIGFMIWVLYAFARARRPRRIRRPADIRLHSRLPIMVEAAAMDGGHREVCRRLRNIIFDAEARTVLVAGAPSATAVAVAYELAELCTEGGSATTVLLVRAAGADRDIAEVVTPPLGFPVRFVRGDDDRHLAAALRAASRESALVLIATPDLNGADTISAAVASDLTLVIVERGRALDREVAAGVRALDLAATPARGLVLTAPARE